MFRQGSIVENRESRLQQAQSRRPAVVRPEIKKNLFIFIKLIRATLYN